MTTLIAIYNSEGCVGRCDARCYDARGPVCVCCCGGINHGKGLEQATDNTRELAEAVIEDWRTEHDTSEPLRYVVPVQDPAQLALV